MRILSSFLATCICIALLGCDPGAARVETPATVPASSVVRQFEDRVARQGSLTFLSNDGKWVRMCGDREITFFRNGTLQLTSYSIGISSHSGIYTFGKDGELSLTFSEPTYTTFPTMRLYERDKSLVFVPLNDPRSLTAKPTTRPEDVDRMWQFRSLPPSTNPKRANDSANSNENWLTLALQRLNSSPRQHAR